MGLSATLSGVRPWLTFLSLAAIMLLICFVSNDRVQSIFWPSTRDTITSWPLQLPSLESWELDTEIDYSLSREHLKAQRRPASERHYEFEVGETQALLGEKLRRIITVNHKFLGPLIEANEGDTIRVHVKNRLEVPTSLHFHGIAMNGTNFFDGAPGITQCGIPPGMEFEYVFKAEPAGTYWYHSHSGLQFAKGFVGPIVIHRRSELESEAPQQHVILLNDLYHDDPDDLMAIYREPWLGGDSEPVPDVALAQGKTYPRVSTGSDGAAIFRLINAASNTAFTVQLGWPAVNFTVLEADGTLLKPVEKSRLLIFPSQRYTILAPIASMQWLFTTPQFAFYDAAESKHAMLKRRSAGLRVLIQNNSSISALPDPPPAGDSFNQFSREELEEPYFEPLGREAIPQPDIEKYVDLSMTRTSEGSIAGAINNEIAIVREQGNILGDLLHTSRSRPGGLHHNHAEPGVPVIIAFGGPPLVVTANYTVADMLIRNFDDGFHPIHLHGHKFWVVERGKLPWARKADASDSYGEPLDVSLLKLEAQKTYWDSPLKRDTVVVSQDEWVRIRLVLDNPGYWLLHCHIPWHSLSGMRSLIVSLPNVLKSQESLVPNEWWQLCRQPQQHPQTS